MYTSLVRLERLVFIVLGYRLVRLSHALVQKLLAVQVILDRQIFKIRGGSLESVLRHKMSHTPNVRKLGSAGTTMS